MDAVQNMAECSVRRGFADVSVDDVGQFTSHGRRLRRIPAGCADGDLVRRDHMPRYKVAVVSVPKMRRALFPQALVWECLRAEMHALQAGEIFERLS